MGDLVPFQRRTRPATATPSPSRGRELAARQNAEHRGNYQAAIARKRNQDLIEAGRIVPARITIALDTRGLEGPEVDVACGGQEPDVDLWECGVTVPTAEQLRLLADLTGFPIAWFYQPVKPGPLLGGPVWMCGPSGCTSVEPNYVDEAGVLHYGGEPPRTPPLNFQPALFDA